jgi:hypothetical protein
MKELFPKNVKKQIKILINFKNIYLMVNFLGVRGAGSFKDD